MSVRYLRRPAKARAAKKAAVSAKAAHATPGGSVADAAPVASIAVEPEECEQMAQALAYFCVACGREHETGEVRGCDIARAEADIIAAVDAIRRCP